MFKKLINRLIDFVAYLILGVLGLGIFNVLHLAWFTDIGRFIIVLITIFVSIIWSFYRLFNSKRK